MRPILYSFRRCPYAMRARLAIRASAIQVELREVILREKPPEMLAISPKGTVPVLQLPDGQIVDESLDIVWWVLQQNDPLGWLNVTSEETNTGKILIETNDTLFKTALDRYKYPNRYAGDEREEREFRLCYRQQGEGFLQTLEACLSQYRYLLGEQVSFADIAIFPFVRQFAHVDAEWFYATNYSHLQQWLNLLLESKLFRSVMQKYPAWKTGDPVTLF
ncbi:MAG: glutathione S-transferase [Candidatus Polarisedimenticolaceae bacterium]|nr:glutathione S-transferase [Candidatus Polarisedimenticolaceae bacterium]